MAGEGDDLSDLSGSTVDGAEETTATDSGGSDAGAGEADGWTDSAPPAADDWKAPTREEWEATRKHAEIGQRFAPYAEDIDGFVRGRLRGGSDAPATTSTQRGAAKSQSQEPDDLEDLLGPKYADTLTALNQDGRVWERIFRGLDKKLHGERRSKAEERMDKLAAKLADLEAYNDLIAPRRFNESADWKQSGKDYIGLLQKGLNDPAEAWKIARDRASKQGATPAQAATAGDKAAAKVEAVNAGAAKTPARAPAVGTGARPRPVPATDKILDAPGRKPTGAASESPRRGRGKNRPGAEAEAMFRAALAQHGIKD